MNDLLRYATYGFVFDSPLDCPELTPSSSAPDVVVRYGEVDAALDGAVDRGARYQTAPGRFVLEIDGIARFLARNGNEVVIERWTGEDDAVRLFLLGSVFGALLQQRGVLALHACAVEIEGRGCGVFMGPSGVGKSTLAAALYGRGHSVLCDDVCTITFEEGPTVQPAYPYVKLWRDAVGQLGHDAGPLRRIRPAIEKHVFPVDAGFCTGAQPLKWLYVIETSNEDELRLSPVRGPEKLAVLLRNTYRAQFIEGLGTRAAHFEQVARLAEVPLTQVVRPRKGFRLDELAALVERDLATS